MSFLLSVIIPVYKTEKLIERCLMSVCEQTLKEFEIILVDDCSPDAAIEKAKLILEKYPERFRNTNIIRLNENHGISYVRKIALNSANGKYIASLDSDDYFEHNALEEMLDFVEKNEADIGFFDYYLNCKNKSTLVKQNVADTKSDTVIKNLLLNELHGALWNKVFKKEILDKVEIVDGINVMEDFLISIQAFFLSEKICYKNSAYLHYVQHGMGSYTSNYNEKSLNDMINSIRYLEKFFEKNKCHNEYIPYISYRKLLIKTDVLTNTPIKYRRNYFHLFLHSENELNFVKKLPIYKSSLIWASNNNFYLIVNFLVWVRKVVVFLKWW